VIYCKVKGRFNKVSLGNYYQKIYLLFLTCPMWMNDISIELTKDAYVPGEIIKGNIILDVEKTVKARAVKLRIIGLEKTSVTVGSGDDRRTYHERNYILKNDIILHSPMYDKSLELNPGNYAFRFEFIMPENALPSYHGTNVFVSYHLEARVDVPWWLDVVEKKPIFVFRNRDALRLLTAPVKFTSDNFLNGVSKKPCFGVELTKVGFLAGETVQGTIAMYNMAASKIRKIYIRLLGEELATARGHHDTTIQSKQEIEIPMYDMMEGVAKVFFLQIPNNAPSSYEGMYSNFRWGVEVGLDIPFGFDVKAVHPIEVLQ
jgi:hypothetical protein